MHGRARQSEAPSAEAAAAQAKRAATYTELSRVLLARRKEGDVGPETFELVGKMLRSNPDFSTLWNYRRDILLSRGSAEGVPLAAALAARQAGGGDKEAFVVPQSLGGEMLKIELALTEDCIKRNPKSYGAWYHRQWLVSHFEFDAKAELDLCAMLLTADQRNFHCWNYRRFVAKASGASSQSEFEFSTLKLNENFSNYSAFHHRSVYISDLALTESAFQHLVTTELSLVENAIFTEPDDQSAWWYRQFLLTWMLRGFQGKEGKEGKDAAATATECEQQPSVSWVQQTLLQQVELLDGLLEIEAGCRWAAEAALQTLRLLVAHGGGGEWAAAKELQLLEQIKALTRPTTPVLLHRR